MQLGRNRWRAHRRPTQLSCSVRPNRLPCLPRSALCRPLHRVHRVHRVHTARKTRAVASTPTPRSRSCRNPCRAREFPLHMTLCFARRRRGHHARCRCVAGCRRECSSRRIQNNALSSTCFAALSHFHILRTRRSMSSSHMRVLFSQGPCRSMWIRYSSTHQLTINLHRPRTTVICSG